MAGGKTANDSEIIAMQCEDKTDYGQDKKMKWQNIKTAKTSKH